MFGLDITEKREESNTNPVGKPQDGFKKGFLFSPLICQLSWLGQRLLLFPVGCWGRNNQCNELREGRKEE